MHGVQKKEIYFYDLFCGQCKKMLEVGEYFFDWISNYRTDNIAVKADKLSAMERECDEEAHRILREVSKSFVTPFDREDIFMIVNDMDKIVDSMEKTANSFYIYNIEVIRPYALRQAENNIHSMRELMTMFRYLKDFKKTDVVLKQIIEVNRLENVGDTLYRDALKELFQTETDPVEIIKWQNIYDHLEKCTDICESVANAIEGVIMKYA
ncbi:MAG: DUF47 family protein [Bacillota bacterium]|nr:DUF47 family protein [Bacillota bacterium]